MECELALGAESRFELKGAVLVYAAGHLASGAFAAWHEAHATPDQAPHLSAAMPLSTNFLRELARGLGSQTKPEILPDNVLVRTPDTLIWWTPTTRRRMFFRHDDPLSAVSGRSFSHPALLFKVTRSELWLRALSTNKRPAATTPLMIAPYYNVNIEGAVCQGSMRSPADAAVASIPLWENAFFGSEFTHLYGAGNFTPHPGGLIALWTSLTNTTRFPTAALVPANETLAQFAERDQ
ncbi:MAG: PRTRC system protein B [Bryobacteraceae bacterium]